MTVDLSLREKDVLAALMRDGADNETIARRLGINRETVRTHMRSLLKKVGVSNRTALALAIERGDVVIAR